MSGLQAALGISQISSIENTIEKIKQAQFIIISFQKVIRFKFL